MSDDKPSDIVSPPPPAEPLSPVRRAPTAVSEVAALRAAVLAALIEIETDTAAKWGAEQHNDGARAAAAVLRRHVGLLIAIP